jgi:hypothetical protein
MDLTRYIFQRGNHLEIVLGKISDISNKYLILEYTFDDKKSASGKTYWVIDLKSTNQFFDSKSSGLIIKSFDLSLLPQIHESDYLGSIVRYDYDKYLWVAVWLNTYAQLNIPSPVFFNVENVMNDLRMMYFGKQSEDEILNSIRNNWQSGKYANDLKIPLIDISKKFSDEFSILDEPKDTEKLRNLVLAKSEEKDIKNESEVDFRIIKKFSYIKPYSSFEKSLRAGNLFLQINSTSQDFNIYNDYMLYGATYTLSFIKGDNTFGNKALYFFPSLLLKKDKKTYDAYFSQIEVNSHSTNNLILLKAGDFIRENIKFTLNEKYEIGTLITSKSEYVIIGAFYDDENILRYVSISTTIFESDKNLSNNATLKKIKYFTEQEIDDLAKKKKVSIVEPLKSSYTPQEELSDVQISSPFQIQTIAKLSDELDAVRNKNEVLYNAFINVINTINKKIQDKIPKLEKSPQVNLYGMSHNTLTYYDIIRKKPDFDLNLFFNSNNNNFEIIQDEFLMSSIQKQNLGEEKIKYFTNPDDLVAMMGKILLFHLKIISVQLPEVSNSQSAVIELYNLPLYLQDVRVDFYEYQDSLRITIGKHVMNLRASGFQYIRQYSFERQLEFSKNLIRMSLNNAFIERIRLADFIDFEENDSWKKSLIMLKPYFTLDYELLQTIQCTDIAYVIPQTRVQYLISQGSNPYNWISRLKFDDYSSIPQEYLDRSKLRFVIYPQREEEEKEFVEYLKKYDQTSADVFNGAPLPQTPIDIETEDFLSQLDEMDFSDESLFVDSIVDEVNNLDFDDPSLFN